jgi:hypothetical protein
MNVKTDISVPLIRAFSAAWAAIQRRHPDVPDVVVTMGAGSGRVAGGLVLGHFAPHRWAKGDESVHELFVGGEGLKRGAREVMATLLHEAAHGAAIARDIQDVSRGGRYHNGRFRELAEELGIQVTFSKVLGWSDTIMPDETATKYRREIERLEAAMVAYRLDPAATILGGLPGGLGGLGAGTGAGKGRDRGPTNNGVSLTCACEPVRRIRVSHMVHDGGPIQCGVCGEEFTED